MSPNSRIGCFERTGAVLTLNFCYYMLQLYDVNLSGDPEESIYGIMFEKFPSTPKSDRKYFIMVSTLRYILVLW